MAYETEAQAGAGLVGAAPLVLDSGDSSVAEARRATSAYVHAHCGWAHESAVVLVLSELLTNAVRHGGGWWHLRVTAGERRLSIEVEDASPLLPDPRAADLSGAGGGGLGMHIVARLTSRFETRRAPSGEGKTLRVEWLREPENGESRPPVLTKGAPALFAEPR